MGWFSKKPDNTTPIQLMNDAWGMYFKWMGDNEEYPVMMFFDDSYSQKLPGDYDEGVELMIRVNDDLIFENAMLKPDTNRDLQARENVLYGNIERSGIHTKLVGRMVGVGRKYYRFQTRDVKALASVLEQWANEIPFLKDRQVKTEKGWEMYKRILPDLLQRMQMSDMQVINTLVQHGLNEDELHPLDFNFSGPSEKLDIIQKDLEEESFVAIHREANRMTMQKPLPLDLQTVYQATSYMKMSAMAHDCEYDGWGCRIN